jgi:Uma2 family endonuclease
MSVDITRKQFTVGEYARMREAGILAEDDRLELLDGEIRVMSPIGPRHAAIVNRLNAAITQALGSSVIVSIQNPIQLDDYSEPQPDLAILHPRDDFYADAHPRPDDVVLVIEIADSSLAYDRDEKLPRYAEAGIAEAWLIDVTAQTIAQCTQPRNGAYRNTLIVTSDETLEAQAAPGVQISVGQLFR